MENIKRHQIYSNYGYNINTNEIVNVLNKKIMKQNISQSGYSYITVRNNENIKTYVSHRFIWECCNDLIPVSYEIDHINKIRTDNRIDNLRCTTIGENRKNRDHSKIVENASKAFTLVRFIKAINRDTHEFSCFESKSKCAKYFEISPALIYLIIEKKNKVKNANTKKGKYYFEYVDENDIEHFIDVIDGRKNK